jgi:hypothetical protein
MFAAVLMLGCTATEDVLDIESEGLGSAVELEFVIIPPLQEAPTNLPPPATLEPPPTPKPTPARWEMWRVLEDVDAWLRLEVDPNACDVELPQFPTVAADGTVLALALISAPVADQQLLTVRLLGIEDAKQVRAYTLLGPGEWELETEEVQRRVCHRANVLARALASGGHTSVPVVGGWENEIRDGLPERVEGWPRVLSDGATREVDATVADVVIARSHVATPELQLRTTGPQSCDGASSQFSKVWETGDLRVFTRGPCGC